MRKIFFARKCAPAGKEGTVPVLAPDIETLDVIAMLDVYKRQLYI